MNKRVNKSQLLKFHSRSRWLLSRTSPTFSDFSFFFFVVFEVWKRRWVCINHSRKIQYNANTYCRRFNRSWNLTPSFWTSKGGSSQGIKCSFTVANAAQIALLPNHNEGGWIYIYYIIISKKNIHKSAKGPDFCHENLK